MGAVVVCKLRLWKFLAEHWEMWTDVNDSQMVFMNNRREKKTEKQLKEATTEERDSTFNFEALAGSLRKEIAEYGSLLGMIYEQQNCLMNGLLKESLKIESQLAVSQLAIADRAAMIGQLAEKLHCGELSLNELPKVVPEPLRSMFKALVEEIVGLQIRIKDKTQFQLQLLEQARAINHSIMQQVFA